MSSVDHLLCVRVGCPRQAVHPLFEGGIETFCEDQACCVDFLAPTTHVGEAITLASRDRTYEWSIWGDEEDGLSEEDQ